MTAYNRLNGVYCAEHDWLLRRRAARRVGLRGLRGLRLVRARVDRQDRPRAGLDLEMPGPGRVYGPALAEAVQRRRGRRGTRRRRGHAPAFACFDRLGALDDSPSRAERRSTVPSTARSRATRRRSRWCSCSNDGVLPLDPSSIATLAVIGPNAERAASWAAARRRARRTTASPPLERSRERVGDRREDRPRAGLRHRAHHPADASPTSTSTSTRAPSRGPGRATTARRPTHLRWARLPGGRAPSRSAPPRRSFRRRPDRTCCRSCSSGRRRVLLDGDARPRRRHRSTAARPRALRRSEARRSRPTVDLDADAPHELVVEYTGGTSGPLEASRSDAARCRPPTSMDRAVAAAAGADAAIVVVGTNDDWESEGHDRESWSSPATRTS